MNRHFVRSSLSVSFRDYSETAAIVPHRPTDSILLKNSTNVVDPCRAIFRVRILSKGAKLITGNGNIPSFCPLRNRSNFHADASCIPTLHAISQNNDTVGCIGNQGCHTLCRLTGRGIGKPTVKMPEVYAPGRSLMGKYVRLV